MSEIINDDCLVALPKLADDSVKMTFTSPPYNTGNSGKNKGMYKNYGDNLKDEEYFQLLDKSLKECMRVSSGLVFYNLNFMRNNTRTILRWLHENSEFMRDIITWDKCKVQPPIGNIVGKRCEYIYIFSKDKKAVINDFRKNKAANYKEVFGSWLSNLCKVDLSTDKTDAKIHRAGFPVNLPKVFIDMYSEEGDTILDPFMGLGATAVAAKMLGREYLGIEMSPEYVEIIKERIK